MQILETMVNELNENIQTEISSNIIEIEAVIDEIDSINLQSEIVS